MFEFPTTAKLFWPSGSHDRDERSKRPCSTGLTVMWSHDRGDRSKRPCTTGLTVMWSHDRDDRSKRQLRRERKAGFRARLKRRAKHPSLPGIILADVRTRDNKVEELRMQLTSQRDIKECCVFVFKLTWLTETTLKDGFSILLMDRTATCGKSKGEELSLLGVMMWKSSQAPAHAIRSFGC